MKTSISLLATSLVLLFATSTVSAVPITGRIDFFGGADITPNVAKTQVDSMTFYTNPKPTVVNIDHLVTGVYDGLEGAMANFTNLNLSAVTPYPLWEVFGFTFDVTGVTLNTYTATGDIFDLAGTGIMGGNMYDDTAGTWFITGQGVNQQVSFSSTAVPAPAGAALLGLGLLGFGFARRNKKAS